MPVLNMTVKVEVWSRFWSINERCKYTSKTRRRDRHKITKKFNKKDEKVEKKNKN